MVQTEGEDETIIAIMGASGSGKSSFINLVAGTSFAVGNGPRSCTKAKGIEVSPPFVLAGKRTTLIDLPGFDDTNLTERELLTMIALFLSHMYEEGRLITGVIFLYRISDVRISDATRRNFRLCQKLCGDTNMENVVIATNMWGQVDPDVGAARELELAAEDTFFRPALLQGAQLVRHHYTLGSARNILQSLIDKPPATLQIQRELVLERKDITETVAGQELNQEQRELVQPHRAQLAEIQRQMEIALAQKDAQSKLELEKLRDELLDEMRKSEREGVKDRQVASRAEATPPPPPPSMWLAVLLVLGGLLAFVAWLGQLRDELLDEMRKSERERVKDSQEILRQMATQMATSSVASRVEAAPPLPPPSMRPTLLQLGVLLAFAIWLRRPAPPAPPPSIWKRLFGWLF